MVNLRELAIVRKYTGEWEVTPLLIDIPPNTSITITYSPPKNRVYVYQYTVSGYMKCDENYTLNIYWDGVRAADYNIQGSLINKVFEHGEAPLKIVRHSLSMKINNFTDETQTFDFIVFGFVIPEHYFEPFIEDVTGEKDRKLAMEQIHLLKEIKQVIKEIKTIK